MRPQVRTCLFLLVGVLTSPSSGGTIGSRDGRIYFKSADSSDPWGEGRTAGHPLWKINSRPRNVRTSTPEVGGGVQVTQEEVPVSTPEPLQNTSPGEAQQGGTSEPPVEVRPLLDIDQLIAIEMSKLKTTPAPSTSTSRNASVPAPVTVSSQTAGDKVIPSQLGEVIKSIFDESAIRDQPTTRRPVQPPRLDLTPQKPPLVSNGNTSKFSEFLPQLKQVLRRVITKLHPVEPQPPRSVNLPPQQTPTVPNTEEDLKHILPTLEETLGSILKNSEAKVTTTTSRPVLPPARPPQAPKVPGTEEDLKHILPTLEETLASILKNSEAKVPTTTSRPVLPPVRPPQAPKMPGTEEDLKHILPTLEETLGSILKNSEAKVPTTTSRPVLPPVRPPQAPKVPGTEQDLKHILPTLEETLTSILKNSEAKEPTTTSWPVLPPVRPPQIPKVHDTDEDLKHILPTLEETLGSILKNSEAKVSTTTSWPILPPVRPTPAVSKEHFAAVLPQLEDAIRSILEEAVSEQEANAKQHTAPPPAWQPTPPTTKGYGFGNFQSELEQMFGDILQNAKSSDSATLSNTDVSTSTVTVPTEHQSSFQSNAIVPDNLSSHSKPLPGS